MELKNRGFNPREKRSKRKPSSAFDDPWVIRARDLWIHDDGVRTPTWLVRSEDPFRNPGDTFLPDVISSKFNPNNPRLRVFVRDTERAVKLWNENHKDTGDLLELLEVVSGHEAPDLAYHTGHFNLKAVSLHDPTSFSCYFFTEVETGTWDDDGPDMMCGSRITTCSELKPCEF